MTTVKLPVKLNKSLKASESVKLICGIKYVEFESGTNNCTRIWPVIVGSKDSVGWSDGIEDVDGTIDGAREGFVDGNSDGAEEGPDDGKKDGFRDGSNDVDGE